MNFSELFGIREPKTVRNAGTIDIIKRRALTTTTQSITKVGIEIELENFRLSAPVTKEDGALDTDMRCFWAFKEDGSLRNRGIELVTFPGLTAEQISIGLKVMELYLNRFSPAALPNFRTGLHIHLNCLDFTLEQLGNLFLLYALFESTLFNISGARSGSRYSAPIRESTSSYGEILNWFNQKKDKFENKELKVGPLHELIEIGQKYSAFNYRSLLGFGTVEFRQHKGTKSQQEINSWMNTLLDLHSAAKRMKFDSLLSHIKELNTISTYLQLRDDVFNSQKLPIPDDIIIKDMAFGSSFVKECLIEKDLLPDLEVRDLRIPLGRDAGRLVGHNPFARPVQREEIVIRENNAIQQQDDLVEGMAPLPMWQPTVEQQRLIPVPRAPRIINYIGIRRETDPRLWNGERDWNRGMLFRVPNILIRAAINGEVAGLPPLSRQTRAWAKEDLEDWIIQNRSNNIVLAVQPPEGGF